jgi:hypothetical protein
MASITLAASAAAVQASVLIDFQSATSYDNSTTTQTFGDFRDVVNNAQSNRTNGGSGSNYFLRLNGAANPSTVYDTTPANAGTTDTFAAAIGQTLSLSVDYRYVLTGAAPTGAGQRAGGFNFGFYNASGTGVNTGISGFFSFDLYPGTAETNAYRYLNDLSAGTFTSIGSTSMGDLSANAYRLQLDFTNLSATTGKISFTIYSLTDLEGTIISQIASRADFTFTYGTGSNQLDVDPNNLSLFVRGNLTSGAAEDVDRFYVVPEPSPGALLGLAAVGGLVIRRLRQRR